MSNEQQELLDEANNNYLNKCLDKKWMKENVFFDGSSNHHLYLKEEFIHRCKTDSEFSEKWGLTIEERELSLEERVSIWDNTHNPAGNIFTHNQYDENNIPKRAISLRYNHKTITSYEY
jgi:hypothetical protein